MKSWKFEKFLTLRNPKGISKKGQITLFIIVGAILLISVGSFLYFRSSVQRIEITPEIIAAQKIPTAFNPVSVFVESCIRNVGEDGLRLLGSQGGYTDLEMAGIAPGTAPTEGNAVIFSPGSEFKIPYWFYLKDDNTCIGTCAFDSEQPELTVGPSSIKVQLEEYIKDNLKECFNDFKALKSKGYSIQEFGDVKAEVTIAEKDIVILVNYLIEAKALDAVHDLEGFTVAIPIELKRMYELATLITNLEAEHRFIDKHSINLIAGFSAKDKNSLPPMSAVGLEFGSTLYWLRSDVIENLKSMLMAYIPMLQVEGTRNYRPILAPGEPLKESLYNQQVLIPNPDYYDFNVNFDYLGWDPYMDINCKGELCQPESVSSSVANLFGLQRYSFAYDLSFPVMVEVHDPDAFGGEGYSLSFMLEANVRNNKVMEQEFSPLRAIEPEISLMCDPDKRNSGDITIDTTGAIAAKPIDDVKVSFSCADEACFIGYTEQGSLIEPFPICAGGIVSFIKEGYLGYSQFLNTRLDEEENLNIKLLPLVDKQFIIKKKRVVKNPEGWVFIDNALSLGRHEKAFISLARKGKLGDEPHRTAAEYSDGIGEITMVPGEYEINIHLYTNETFVIPEQERCQDVAFTEKCYTLERLEFNESFPNGGLEMNYTFSIDDLRKDVITFYVINTYLTGIPESIRVMEDLEVIDSIDEYSAAYADRLRPTFE